jgi:hypothetical protein
MALRGSIPHFSLTGSFVSFHAWMHARAPWRCNILIRQPESTNHEKINNNRNVNFHQQDVVLPDCVHPGAPRSMVFFSFQRQIQEGHITEKKTNNQILMPSMCIPIHDHASGQLSQITEETIIALNHLCLPRLQGRTHQQDYSTADHEQGFHLRASTGGKGA